LRYALCDLAFLDHQCLLAVNTIESANMTSKSTIRVAIAGAGMVTRHHLHAWRKLPRVEVVAICARHLANAESRAKEFKIPAAYDDVAVMLDQRKPDVLDIATPPEVHRQQANLAADRGIDILCQKPMTPDLAESERLVAEIGERVRFMIHENWRFRPQYRQAAKWSADGRIGTVSEFHLSTRSSGLIRRGDSGKPFALERQPFMAGLKRFIIMELLIHHLDTIRYLVGPVSVDAANTARICQEVRGEDAALIHLRSGGGAFGTVAGNFSAAGFPPLPSDRLVVVGDKGSIIFEGNELRLLGETEKTVSLNLEQAYQQSYDDAIAHFVRALQADTPFETDRLDNLQTLQLVEDAYRKAEAGMKIED
jgi:predicted dehydrogenase